MVANEGRITFDIRFSAILPGKEEKELIKILINVEAQNRSNPGYDLVTRAIFYCARMLSAQLGTEFSLGRNDKKKYDNLKKVYSIWICVNTTEEAENTIDKYQIERTHLVGNSGQRSRYDLLSVVMICLGKQKDAGKTENELLKMLSTLLDMNITINEKKKRLEEEHGIPMTREVEEEVGDMCNIGEYYMREWKEQGLKKGMEEVAMTP